MGMTSSTDGDIDPRDFTRFDPVPPEGIARAVAIMQTGRLFRYADSRPEDCEVALLERDFAEYLGVRHALGVSSCSKAIELALIACGVERGSKVLVPGFTFTAVPSAIMILGAIPVFVECTDDYVVDVDDLARKIAPDTKVLLLSHMRGHTTDMDAVVRLCDDNGVTLIEDAAHALGGRWRGRKVGSFGKAGCFSFQSNKIINAGEGGVLTTDDDELIVKAIHLSGAYEGNHRKHFAQSDLFESLAGELPLHNARMTNVTAAIARAQIALIEPKAERYRRMYAYLRGELTATNRIVFPHEYPHETRVPDSIQFRALGFDRAQMQTFIEKVRARGLPLSGFSDPDNARAYYNWRYLDGHMPDLPQTRKAIANACDMRLPSMLEERHLAYLVATVRAAIHETDGR